MIRLLICLLLVAAGIGVAAGQERFPLWERILKHYSGTTDETVVPSMKMGNHMQMSLKRDPAPGDSERAQAIVAQASEVVSHYRDVNTALHDGYKPFYPTGRLGEEIHYTNYRFMRREQKHVDYSHPGSILYRRTSAGLVAVGVMYTAPPESNADQLNAIAPLSVATWHRHVDFCAGPKNLSMAEQFGEQARFGPSGSIHTESDCAQAHGLWIPVVFNWMTHVYPNDKIQWGGQDMQMGADAPAT